MNQSSHTVADPAALNAELKPAQAAGRTNPIVYTLAVLLGLFAGWINEMVRDPLLTALCVVAFSMLMGVWKKQRPWRWLLLVWIGVPIMFGYYQFVVHWPHNRGQVCFALVQILAASAGAHGGHFMRDMIDHVFLRKEEE
jgi:hypothetical protein